MTVDRWVTAGQIFLGVLLFVIGASGMFFLASAFTEEDRQARFLCAAAGVFFVGFAVVAALHSWGL